MSSKAMIDRDFATIEAAAVAGERCPQTTPHGPIQHGSTSVLAKAGRIRIDIFAHNWRVVTIMEGPHKGKQTKGSPYKGSGKPYRTIYKDHATFNRPGRGGFPSASAKPVSLAPIKLPPMQE